MEVDTLVARISAYGWKQYLATVRRSDAKSFYAYLAKAAGRKIRGFAPADSVPLIFDGRFIISKPDRSLPDCKPWNL